VAGAKIKSYESIPEFTSSVLLFSGGDVGKKPLANATADHHIV
jgi:hypothetical protein